MATFLTLWAGSVFNEHPKCQDPFKPEGETLAWCDTLSVTIGILDISLIVVLASCFVWLKTKGKSTGVIEGEQAEVTVLGGSSVWSAVSDQMSWISSRVLSEERRQARTRSRTVDSSDPANQSRRNPLEESSTSSIQMVELGGERGEEGGTQEENQRGTDARRVASLTEAPPPAPTRASESGVGGAVMNNKNPMRIKRGI